MRRMLVFWWVVSVFAAAALSSALTLAQTNAERVLTGEDIGFRIEGTSRNGEPRGTWVVRVKREWIVPASVPSVRRLNPSARVNQNWSQVRAAARRRAAARASSMISCRSTTVDSKPSTSTRPPTIVLRTSDPRAA